MTKGGETAPSIDYEDALRLIPVLVNKGNLGGARRWVRRVVAAKPKDARAWNQFSLLEGRLGNFIGAQQMAKIAYLLEPGLPELLVNRGNITRLLQQHRWAQELFRKALMARPEDPEIAVALALQYLTNGDYESGLALYERRWSRRTAMAELATLGIPAWDGDPASASRLVCMIEQGAGDTIQFVRYAAELSQRGVEVIVYCTEPLARILASATGVSASVTRLRGSGIDAAEMMMSLPYRCGTRVDAVPAPGRYIDPPAHSHRLPTNPGRPKVGLCWAGNPNHRRDSQRSCPYDELAALLDVTGIDFFSLQVGDGADACRGDERITDLSSHIDDFADTAGLIDQMDLVITIDSAVAHVTGALDRPCWILLHWVADWRWGQRGETTGWYPRTRLFRRDLFQEWPAFLPQVRAALEAWRDDWVRSFASSKTRL
jgi:hypothetical protein